MRTLDLELKSCVKMLKIEENKLEMTSINLEKDYSLENHPREFVF